MDINVVVAVIVRIFFKVVVVANAFVSTVLIVVAIAVLIVIVVVLLAINCKRPFEVEVTFFCVVATILVTRTFFISLTV
jgi:hypothetical protein